MTELIKSYDKTWIDYFNSISFVLDKALVGISLVIEHVGSTSVEGLSAKPIIDIDIAHTKADDFNKINKRLESIGYVHNGDQGIPGREAFNRTMNCNDKILDSIRHHLYVCHQDNDEFKRHIIFRDYLRKNEWAKIEYQNLKMKMAQKTNNNHKEYANLKETEARSFIERIIKLGGL